MISIKDFFLGEGDDESGTEATETEVSAYDGRPLNTYTGVVNGRRVTVHSSWRPGDPPR